MPREENESKLTFTLQREIEPGGGRFTERESAVYFKRPGRQPELERTYFHTFNKVGSRIAIVQKYDEEMFDRLKVNAIVEARDILGDHSNIYEHSTTRTDGMTYLGKISKPDDNLSLESIQFEAPDSIGVLKPGFTPMEKFAIPLGNAADGKALQLMIQDIRPMPALEIMSAASLK
jgi:hypothetical protein